MRRSRRPALLCAALSWGALPLRAWAEPTTEAEPDPAVRVATEPPSSPLREEPRHVDPGVALRFALGFGAAGLAAPAELDHALGRAGRSELGTAIGPAALVRLGVELSGFAIDLVPSATFFPEPDARHATTQSSEALMVEVGYDALPSAFVRFGPAVGAGAVRSLLCVSGQGTSPADASVFGQLAAAPGPGVCLARVDAALRLGLAGGVAATVYEAPFATQFTLDLRPSLTWALGDADYEAPDLEELGAFPGPAPGRIGLSLLLEAGVAFGYGRRTPGI